mgnify:CR=1 FL=1
MTFPSLREVSRYHTSHPVVLFINFALSVVTFNVFLPVLFLLGPTEIAEQRDTRLRRNLHTEQGTRAMERHFGDDLRYVVRHLPHHPHGPIAARASEAASNQGMFWPWLDFVFTRQHALEREDLIGYAAELGLDVDRFIVDLDSPLVIERVQRDLVSAVASGAHATPTFFVDGRRLRGSYDARTLTAALEASRRGTRTQEVES